MLYHSTITYLVIVINTKAVHTHLSFFFLGCVDDTIVVLAEEHGCLDIIKVRYASVWAVLTDYLRVGHE